MKPHRPPAGPRGWGRPGPAWPQMKWTCRGSGPAAEGCGHLCRDWLAAGAGRVSSGGTLGSASLAPLGSAEVAACDSPALGNSCLSQRHRHDALRTKPLVVRCSCWGSQLSRGSPPPRPPEGKLSAAPTTTPAGEAPSAGPAPPRVGAPAGLCSFTYFIYYYCFHTYGTRSSQGLSHPSPNGARRDRCVQRGVAMAMDPTSLSGP